MDFRLRSAWFGWDDPEQDEQQGERPQPEPENAGGPPPSVVVPYIRSKYGYSEGSDVPAMQQAQQRDELTRMQAIWDADATNAIRLFAGPNGARIQDPPWGLVANQAQQDVMRRMLAQREEGQVAQDQMRNDMALAQMAASRRAADPNDPLSRAQVGYAVSGLAPEQRTRLEGVGYKGPGSMSPAALQSVLGYGATGEQAAKRAADEAKVRAEERSLGVQTDAAKEEAGRKAAADREDTTPGSPRVLAAIHAADLVQPGWSKTLPKPPNEMTWRDIEKVLPGAEKAADASYKRAELGLKRRELDIKEKEAGAKLTKEEEEKKGLLNLGPELEVITDAAGKPIGDPIRDRESMHRARDRYTSAKNTVAELRRALAAGEQLGGPGGKVGSLVPGKKQQLMVEYQQALRNAKTSLGEMAQRSSGEGRPSEFREQLLAQRLPTGAITSSWAHADRPKIQGMIEYIQNVTREDLRSNGLRVKPKKPATQKSQPDLEDEWGNLKPRRG